MKRNKIHLAVRKSIISTIVLVLLVSCQKQASVREEKLALTTYPFGDPDPVAHPESSVYPYFQFDGYAHQGQPQTWETVVLENDYIRVTIIPAIGGKIWGAVDKTTGKEFIYFNHAVKFRNISMRGPWTSGGIELNFGIFGHAPTTASPVDYYTRKNDDGSASCFVSAFDLITRTWWQVEINLPSDKAYFTTSATWHNTTPLPRPYYQWMNAGYKASDDLEFSFSGQYYIGHNGDVHAWHIDPEGRDLSQYALNAFGGDKSYHVLGNYTDFYGAYYKDSDFGSVHYSPFNDKLGMKIFIWGLSRQGMIWEDLLTDTDGQYVELQSGRLYNQAALQSQYSPFKQFAFEPYGTDTWTEYWYPVKETGGIVKAGDCGALNVTRENGNAIIRFSPVQKIDDDLVITSNGKEIFRKHLTLNVLQTWQETLPLGANPDSPLRIRLGNDRLIYSEISTDNQLSRPVTSPAAFDRNSAYGLYLQGEQEMYGNRYKQAVNLLKQSLSLEPFAIPALRDLAFLYYQQGCFAAADSCARIILSVNAYDSDGNFLYGLANSKLGNTIDAIDGFKVAALSPSHRAAASIGLAKESAKEKNWKQAVQYAEKSLASGSANAESQQLQAVAYRQSGMNKEAEAILASMEKNQPLNHYVRFERYLRTKTEKDKTEFLRYIRSELPHETFMEMAIWYESIACNEEALTLYAFAPEYPIAVYQSAYLSCLQGDDVYKTLLKRAESLPTQLAFPFRTETLPALEWAVNQSNQWVNKYYLSLLYAFLGQNNKASELLEQCGNLPEEATFYLTRAQYRQGEKKQEDLLTAEQLDKSWRVGMALIRYYQETKQYEKMYDYAKAYTALYPNQYTLGLKYAAAMLYQKQYRPCAEYLAQLNVLPNEGAYEGRRVYREAWLLCALQNIRSGDYAAALSDVEKAKLWPENLGVGKPYDEHIDLRTENFITAYCQAKMNGKKPPVYNKDAVPASNMVMQELIQICK
jgi:predicted Zn-dependent protease